MCERVLIHGRWVVRQEHRRVSPNVLHSRQSTAYHLCEKIPIKKIQMVLQRQIELVLLVFKLYTYQSRVRFSFNSHALLTPKPGSMQRIEFQARGRNLCFHRSTNGGHAATPCQRTSQLPRGEKSQMGLVRLVRAQGFSYLVD